MANGPSDTFVRKMTHLFNFTDVNKDGILTKQDILDFAQNYKKFGQMTSEQSERLDQNMAKWWDYTVTSIEGNGEELTLAETIDARFKITQMGDAKEVEMIMKPAVEVMFNSIDTNGDGIISKEEWRSFLRVAGISDDEEAEDSFCLIDEDKNNKMSFTEFFKCVFEFFYQQEETASMHMFGQLP